MTNRPGRPDRTRTTRRRVRSNPSVRLLVAGVWLGSLLNLALNTATNTKRCPGPLWLLQQYPWQATALLTLILALVTWAQNRRATTSLQGSGFLPGVLRVRQEVAPTATELAGLRRQLLEQVHRTWVRGVLDRSLAHVARVELGLAEQPVAVVNPWGALLVISIS